MKLEIINEKDTAVFDQLVSGVREYNAEIMGPEASQPLSAIARDECGKLIGGVSGRTIYKHYMIEVVWVERSARSSGLGRKLMELAEAEARKRGCVGAQVDTLSFQGPLFYQKLGFEIVGKVSGFPEGHDRLFLLKRYTME